MSITTYAELKAAIIGWGKRGDALSVIDDFIDLAESDMWQKLRLRSMEGSGTGNLSGRTLALPSDYIESRKLRLTTNPSTELEFYTPESMNIEQGSGKPTKYTITSQIEFNKVPDNTYGYELTYYKSLTALSSSNTTNDVLTNFPSIYLFGALYHYGNWSMNDVMSAKYLQLFEKAMNDANRRDQRGRYGAAKAMHVEGSTP